MEKLSLTDILGLLVPGIMLLYFLEPYPWFPQWQALLGSGNPEAVKEIGLWLGFAIFGGALLNGINLYLIRQKWYGEQLGMYRHVADIYARSVARHTFMHPVLNKRALEWMGTEIFAAPDEYETMGASQKKKIRGLQNVFYDRMYYELEYHDKIEATRTAQSFYFFFRQTTLACMLLLPVSLVGLSFSVLPCTDGIYCEQRQHTLILVFVWAISVTMARYYRKRMVQKIYWAYFTHLNQHTP